MKKRTIINLMTFVLAVGAAFAFKANTVIPGNLYIYTQEGLCIQSLCATYNEIGELCNYGDDPLYVDEKCENEWIEKAWFRDGY